MKRVWITRTEPGASELGSYLGKSGFSSTVAPVVKIQTVQGTSPNGLIDCWVFVSYHAVQSALKMGWKSSEVSAAIGPATDKALSGHTSSTLVPERHTSEGLFDLLRCKLSPGSKVCLITGRHGREDLEVWLRNAGFKVTRWVVYERTRQSVRVNVSEFEFVIASSAFALSEILATFRKQLLCKREYPVLVVPSERIATIAREMGFSEVQVSDGATKSAVLSVLKSMN